MAREVRDVVSCMRCAALVHPTDMAVHDASHDGEAEAMRRTAQDVLAQAVPEIVRQVVLRLMKGSSS